MAVQVPEDFLFGLKVTDAITIKNFPNLPRFGDLAGKPNPNFLNTREAPPPERGNSGHALVSEDLKASGCPALYEGCFCQG